MCLSVCVFVLDLKLQSCLLSEDTQKYPDFSPPDFSGIRFNRSFAGHSVSGGRLPAARSHGLPRGAAPADVELLAERTGREAALLPDPRRPGQTHPQPSELKMHRHAQPVSWPLQTISRGQLAVGKLAAANPSW